MSKYIIATIKSWNIKNFKSLVDDYSEHDFMLISDKESLNIDVIKQFNPDYIFFPHWSWIIPEHIYNNYNCVVFHMTDLPFGRGGSPLQNLIVRGIYETKISAIKVDAGLDTGDIYLKEDISISDGNADEIFERVSNIVFKIMIPKFINENITSYKQIGDVVCFERRTPAESELPLGLSQRQIYDFIRMLDGEGYPKAFIKLNGKRFTFSDASFKDDKVYAKVSIEDYRDE